jgi:hypothetical protein
MENRTEIYDCGWIFYFNTKAFVEGDESKMFFGANPSFVDKFDGSIHFVHISKRIDFVENYRKQKNQGQFGDDEI